MAISIRGLTFTYRESEKPSLKQITGQIPDSCFTVIMGHGGAGKSTLCCALNGLVPRFFRGKYEGQVVIKGQEVARHKVAEMSRTVGLVLQDFESQLFSTNVDLEMAFGPENQCLPRDVIGERIQRYLRFVGLSPFRHREPATLSGGQKQRLAIGSVLAMEPEILVMDEAMTDLDPEGRKEVLSVADRLKKQGHTLLMVEHEPEVAARADLVWLMRDGQLVAQGHPKEIMTDPSTLKSCGIRIPPTVDLFREMGWPGDPLTPEEAVDLIREHGLARLHGLDPSELSSSDVRRPPILRAEAVRYLYPESGLEALRGIDLSFGQGEFIAILGQNGSGKTTLAKHLNGLLKPSSGKLLVHEKPTTKYSHREMARKVGYVFQNPDHQIFSRTVRGEVGFGLKVLEESERTIDQRVFEALEAVGLLNFEEKVPFSLTKGERQRVAVASVLAAQPEVLVLDEPTTGLDYGHQVNMMNMLKRLNEKGHTVIIITHSMWIAAEYANRIVVMKDGSVLLDGPTRAVFADETRLAEASLRPSSVIRLSNTLGTKALTVEQLVEELRGDNNHCRLQI